MLLNYILFILIGLTFVILGKKKSEDDERDYIATLFLYLGSFLLIIVGLSIVVAGFPYVSAQTEVNKTYIMGGDQIIITGDLDMMNYSIINATWVNLTHINVTGDGFFAGRVGIGTIEPQTALHIATNVGSGVKLERGSLDARWWGGNNGPAYFGTISNDALNFRTNNINRMTIASGLTGGAVDVVNNFSVDSNVLFVDSSSNRVGIGTASPLNTLNVVGDANITGYAIVGTAAAPKNLTMYDPEGTVFCCGIADDVGAWGCSAGACA